MKTKIFKCMVMGLFILTLSLIAQNAKAVPIAEISIPMGSTKYNIDDHTFVISAFSEVTVFYENFTLEKYENVMFGLNTMGLDWEISPDNRTITYDALSGAGTISLLDAFNFSKLLIGDLQSLQMTIIDPFLGLFEGTGNFAVLEGSLASDFGDNGGLATIGIVFKVPFDFSDSFTAMANTKLYPDPPGNPGNPVPEPATMFLLGTGLIGLGWFGRRKKGSSHKVGNTRTAFAVEPLDQSTI